MLTTIEVEVLKRFGDFTKSIKRCLVVKQGLKPSRLLSKGVSVSLVCPNFLVVGGGRVPFDVDLESLVVPLDAVPMIDLSRGTYPRRGARGRGVFEGQLNSGIYSVLGIQGGGFLLDPTLRLCLWLGCGFGLCGRLALLRPLAAPGNGPSSLGRRASGCCTGAWPGANTGFSRAAGTLGWEVGMVSFSWTTCLVMMPTVSSAACRASGGSTRGSVSG